MLKCKIGSTHLLALVDDGNRILPEALRNNTTSPTTEILSLLETETMDGNERYFNYNIHEHKYWFSVIEKNRRSFPQLSNG